MDQRPEPRHAGRNDVNREAELELPSRIACSDLLACFIDGLLHPCPLFGTAPMHANDQRLSHDAGDCITGLRRDSKALCAAVTEPPRPTLPRKTCA